MKDRETGVELRIEAAAIFQGGRVYSVPRPGRHHDVIKKMVHEDGLPTPIRGEQGFLLNTGKFVRRIPARRIAHEAGQFIKEPIHPNELFSEDVW